MGFPEESEELKIFHDLPVDLREKVVASEVNQRLLKESGVFWSLSKEQRTRLCSYLQPRMFSAGHDVWKRGAEVDGLWLLQDGKPAKPLRQIQLLFCLFLSAFLICPHILLFSPASLVQCSQAALPTNRDS